jgi:hypothetical protein
MKPEHVIDIDLHGVYATGIGKRVSIRSSEWFPEPRGMKATLAVLNELEAEGLLGRYAIGGAMGAIFYVEPVATYDLDIFVVLPTTSGGLITLEPLYDALRQRGYEPKDEHVMIEGVPVQFLPAYNALMEEALKQARDMEVEGEPTRVLRIEHLISVAIQLGRPKDHARIQLLTEEGNVDADVLADICQRHGLRPPAAPSAGEQWKPPKP